MNSQQARNLVRQQAPKLEKWVCDHCGQKKHLIPLAMLYVNQRLSEQGWQRICQYDGKQPFVDFFRELVEDALETFSHGVWFGECAKTIHYWIARYNISSDSRRQDAEDYIKNKLAKDNFACFRSYNKEKKVSFPTYISMVIRNLLVDYLRKKTPVTETWESVEYDDHRNDKNIKEDTAEPYRLQDLEEIGQWFFAGTVPQEGNGTETSSPDIPDKIKLNHKERLFLRAMYKDGMTAEEAGRLPGINMGKWQAHSYHRRLKKRIKKLLNEMGYGNLQSLLNPN